ncbi:hypothetical protein PUNSTDRAFT_69138, partial [Punctularia strigosozonata HHB-11173 SS5]|uniref:uncharacterized protein n=1 Tax=Punctularia strigosozonata (strain HHB-11173) TaxID=741275 RepID=UPI000441786D
LTLGPSDTLKLTFQVEEDGKGVQPHQTFLRFYDEQTGEEGIQPVRVSSAGKAKFELNMARPPASLPPTTTHPLLVELLLGSFTHAPAKYTLLSLTLPASGSAPPHPEESTFHPLPPIAHTFRPEQKVPPVFVSAVFVGIVLAPWIVLLGLWSSIKPRVPHLFSPSILPFTALLTAFEGLLFTYWLRLRLGQVLAYGALLAIPTVFAGKHALASASAWRQGRK